MKKKQVMKSNGKPPGGRGPTAAPMAAAVGQRTRGFGLGMPNIRDLKIAWQAGQVWIGDGTNGANGSVYFATNTFVPSSVAGLVPGTSGGGSVPVLAADARVGQTYVADVEKHFSRKIIRRCKLWAVPLSPSTNTTNAFSLAVAPVRGPGASGDTVVFTTATTAAPTIANTIGMAGTVSGPSWEVLELDLTPYIAGGSGAQQNEFQILLDADTTAWGTGAMDMDLTCPCAFVIAGSGNSGLTTAVYSHLIVIEQVVDLLDFVAGNVGATPEALVRSFFREAMKQMDPAKHAMLAKQLSAVHALMGSTRQLSL